MKTFEATDMFIAAIKSSILALEISIIDLVGSEEFDLDNSVGKHVRKTVEEFKQSKYVLQGFVRRVNKE